MRSLLEEYAALPQPGRRAGELRVAAIAGGSRSRRGGTRRPHRAWPVSIRMQRACCGTAHPAWGEGGPGRQLEVESLRLVTPRPGRRWRREAGGRRGSPCSRCCWRRALAAALALGFATVRARPAPRSSAARRSPLATSACVRRVRFLRQRIGGAQGMCSSWIRPPARPGASRAMPTCRRFVSPTPDYLHALSGRTWHRPDGDRTPACGWISAR